MHTHPPTNPVPHTLNPLHTFHFHSARRRRMQEVARALCWEPPCYSLIPFFAHPCASPFHPCSISYYGNKKSSPGGGVQRQPKGIPAPNFTSQAQPAWLCEGQGQCPQPHRAICSSRAQPSSQHGNKERICGASRLHFRCLATDLWAEGCWGGEAPSCSFLQCGAAPCPLLLRGFTVYPLHT